MPRKKLGQILVEAGVLEPSQLDRALLEQSRWGGRLGGVLIDLGMIAEEALVAALSRQLNLPAVDLDAATVSRKIIPLIPADVAEEHGVIPLRVEGKFLDVAMADPTRLGIVDELQIRTQLNVRPFLAGPRAVERALARYYGRGLPPARRRGIDVDPSAIALEVERGTPARPFDSRAQDSERDREIRALQQRLAQLEAMVERDENVLRKLLGLLVDKGVASREEILERIK